MKEAHNKKLKTTTKKTIYTMEFEHQKLIQKENIDIKKLPVYIQKAVEKIKTMENVHQAEMFDAAIVACIKKKKRKKLKSSGGGRPTKVEQERRRIAELLAEGKGPDGQPLQDDADEIGVCLYCSDSFKIIDTRSDRKFCPKKNGKKNWCKDQYHSVKNKKKNREIRKMNFKAKDSKISARAISNEIAIVIAVLAVLSFLMGLFNFINFIW